jgi:hypothetical protein
MGWLGELLLEENLDLEGDPLKCPALTNWCIVSIRSGITV